MPEIGKNAQGLKGFPTPNEEAGTSSYLLFCFSQSEYAQYIIGAARALQYEWNWYKAGDLDPDEAAAAFDLIIQQAPTNKLPSCSLPTGEPLMRIDPATGQIQGVDEDGNWSDDPSIPSTPERPADPPDTQRCLAAANTANALQILYENLSDSFSAGLTDAEAITAFVAGVGEAIAVEFFPPAAALIAVAAAIFGIVYEVVGFVTADVWTDDFTDVLRCYLYECATASDNVVTYDWQCIIDKLAAQTDALDLTASQLRLFGQLYYILSWIGVDGLNYSGSATAITDADCSECGGWCHVVDFTVSDGSDIGFFTPSGVGTWVSGEGWAGQFVDGLNQNECDLRWTGTLSGFTFIQYTYVKTAGGGASNVTNLQVYDPWPSVVVASDSENNLSPDPQTHTVDDAVNSDGIRMDVNAGTEVGTIRIQKAEFHGTGTSPFGADNC